MSRFRYTPCLILAAAAALLLVPAAVAGDEVKDCRGSEGPCVLKTVTAVSHAKGGAQTLVIAYSNDDGTTYDSARVFAYAGTADGLGEPQELVQAGLSQGHRFGYAIAAADFDNDGYGDIAVGAPAQAVDVSKDAGVVFLYRGTATGFEAWGSVDQKGLGLNEDGEQFGVALATGDFNADGFTDLAVGAPRATHARVWPVGGVYLYRGTVRGLRPWRVYHASEPQEDGDRFAESLAAGDFDGDGVDDLAVGAPHKRHVNTSNTGSVFALKGYKGKDMKAWRKISQQGLGDNAPGDGFGASLVAGDFDGNGALDLAVGAPTKDGTGQVFVYRSGSATVLEPWQAIDQSGLDQNEDGDDFGRRLAAGDWNGDGKDDLAVTAAGEDSDGAVYLYNGSQDEMKSAARLERKGLGGALAAGDWNGDGVADLGLIAPDDSTYIYRGATKDGLQSWTAVGKKE